MAYNALPQIVEERLDGNLLTTEVSKDPIILVLGTASRGTSETVYAVARSADARAQFGTSGTLTRGMYEAKTAGGKNVRLYRIGATGATLEDVGGGITIETILKDDEIGTAYEIFWDHSAGRLRVWRASDDELVYDNNPAYPAQVIDLGDVAVSGSAAVAGTWTDIGTLAVPVTLEGADGLGGETGAVYTAGTDGLSLSRMEIYESLYNTYQDLEDQDLDVVIPMDVYLDDNNVMDLTQSGVTDLCLTALSEYPDGGSPTDYLGKVYVEEYEGENYFWWWFPSSPNADLDTTFTSDGGANIFPISVGSANATTTIGGTALTGSDFHEVNFAYQLANFCQNMSSNVIDVTGVIGVRPPASYSPRDISIWAGKLAVTETDGNGVEVIETNGTGLLGNKFMQGRKGSASDDGIPGFTIDGVDGRFGGGFIATDSGFLDGEQLKDENDALIDIGQYLSVVAAYAILANSSVSGAYVATGAASYSGFYTALPANSSPANKTLSFLRLPWRLKVTKVDALANAKYVMFHQKPKGTVVSDAPTAARVESDYRRLTTVRIVKACVDEIRSAAEPFLGENTSDLSLAALESRIDERLSQMVKAQYIRRYDKTITATAQQRVLGQAVCELVLVPAFELRRLTVIVSLAAI